MKVICGRIDTMTNLKGSLNDVSNVGVVSMRLQWIYVGENLADNRS